jgi:hypothetical protein
LPIYYIGQPAAHNLHLAETRNLSLGAGCASSRN